ncbi:hypothetical protein EJB05_45032 [Eragrostis curvula]|uniref:Glycine-rich protein n=1 Tax=Eragrostis curvula TaxID=38414 RepID=A0A5J9TJ45_9POAL|nr:hypothetical protein EJB05_45032 [Eragrostis curvula]
MAVKSVVLLWVVLASVLLICLDVAYARELSEANGSVGRNVEPAARSPGLNDEKWFIIGAGGRGGQPNYGAGDRGGYLPGYGPGYGPVYGGRYGSPRYPGVYGYPGYVSGRIGPGGYLTSYGGVPGAIFVYQASSEIGAEMVVKSLLILGVILASMLLLRQDMAYARELTEANDSDGGPGPKDEKVFGGYRGGYLPEYGRGYGPRYSGGYGVPRYGVGYGVPRYGGSYGIPRYGGGFGQPWYGGGYGHQPGVGRFYRGGYGGARIHGGGV